MRQQRILLRRMRPHHTRRLRKNRRCSDPAVLKANEAHESAWYETRARLNDAERQELLTDQRRWLKEYPPRCGVPAQGKSPAVISRDAQVCVTRALEERRAFLEQYHNPAGASSLAAARPPGTHAVANTAAPADQQKEHTAAPPVPQPVPTPTPSPQGQQPPQPITVSAAFIRKGIECGVGFIPANKLVKTPEILGFEKATEFNGYIAVVEDFETGSVFHLPLAAARLVPHEECVEAIANLLAPGQVDALDQCLAAKTSDEQGCLKNIIEELGLSSALVAEV
jgi:uncharacterized protein YecT (DUF1311 family)